MTGFATLPLPDHPAGTAPDGTLVRPLLALDGGSFAHFELPAGAISIAVQHHRVEEIWYVVAGHGQVWRCQGEREEIIDVGPGSCLTIPLGTAFQFRADTEAPLIFVAVTMPPWPGAHEAYPVAGKWAATVDSADE